MQGSLDGRQWISLHTHRGADPGLPAENWCVTFKLERSHGFFCHFRIRDQSTSRRLDLGGIELYGLLRRKVDQDLHEAKNWAGNWQQHFSEPEAKLTTTQSIPTHLETAIRKHSGNCPQCDHPLGREMACRDCCILSLGQPACNAAGLVLLARQQVTQSRLAARTSLVLVQPQQFMYERLLQMRELSERCRNTVLAQADQEEQQQAVQPQGGGLGPENAAQFYQMLVENPQLRERLAREHPEIAEQLEALMASGVLGAGGGGGGAGGFGGPGFGGPGFGGPGFGGHPSGGAHAGPGAQQAQFPGSENSCTEVVDEGRKR